MGTSPPGSVHILNRCPSNEVLNSDLPDPDSPRNKTTWLSPRIHNRLYTLAARSLKISSWLMSNGANVLRAIRVPDEIVTDGRPWWNLDAMCDVSAESVKDPRGRIVMSDANDCGGITKLATIKQHLNNTYSNGRPRLIGLCQRFQIDSRSTEISMSKNSRKNSTKDG